MNTAHHNDGYAYNEFTGGVLDDLSVSDALMPKNAVRKAVNVMFDRPRGSVSQRYGTTQLGDTMSGTILGIHDHRSSNSSYHKLLAAVGTTIKYLATATWTNTVTGLTTGLKTRFLTYLDVTAFLNGTDQSQAWTGTGAWTTTGGALDIANFPKTKYATVLNGRVFAAGNSTYPTRLYKSSIVSSLAVSWTSGNGTVDVFPNDGSGNISGLVGNGKVILIFKERSMYRYDDNSLERVAFIGCPSQESIVSDDQGVTYFFGQSTGSVGFYATTGGYPKKISRPIQRWVEAIAATNYDDVAAYTDGQKIVWYVGSVTIGDYTYSNCCLVYNISDQTWETRNYADTFKVFAGYINSDSELTIVGGDTDGMVQTMDSGTTDNGTKIFSECEFTPITFGDRGRTKKVDEVMTYATHFQGLDFLLKTDDGPFKKVGSIDEREKHFKSLSSRGNTFYPKITAANSGEPFQFDGFNFKKWGDEG